MLRILLIGTGLALFASVALTAPEAPSPARLEQIVQYHVDHHQFAGAVLVARDDKVLFNKSYGFANREWQVPNTSTTKFRIGSVTKQFTAAAILLLEERGKLKVEDPIKLYYPDAPAAWDKVTLAHLLNHTSGIHSYTNDPEFDKFTKLPTTPAELVKRVHDKPMGFEPGKDMNYSNTGYILLGIAIEKASGKSYGDFLKENVLDPLGMNDSGNDVNATILPHRAAGYSQSPQGIVNAMYTDMTTPYAAGAMYSTPEDLLRWQRGLFGKKLLSDGSLQKMITPALKDYAFGVAVIKKAGVTEVRHGGGIPGFNSHLAYFPDSKTTVVVLANVNGPGPDSIGNKFGALMRGETVQLPSERKTVNVPKQTLEKYVGTYELRPGFNLWFFVKGDQLMSQATNQPEFPLAAATETRFFPLAFEAEIEFQMDATGKVTGLIHRQNGGVINAPRISDTAPVISPPR